MTTFTSWDTELYHHGTPGMEWYKRRYQNEDGSLTTLGRIHYGIGQARERAARKKEARKNRAEIKRQNRPKKISEMTDEELRSAIARKNLEYEYRTAGGGNRVVNALKSINDAYDKKKQQQIDLAKAKAELETAKSESIKAIEATKKAGKEVKRAKQEAKKEKNKHTTWLDRRVIAKQLRKTDTTADIERARADKNATAAKLKDIEGRAKTVESMLKRNTLWDYVKGTAVRNVKGVLGYDRVKAVQSYLEGPSAFGRANNQNDNDKNKNKK